VADALDVDRIYQRIGEFVVSFQWLENRLREIGWLILDPNRTDWPPKKLRKELNENLINKVEVMYVETLDRLDVEQAEERKKDFQAIVQECHTMREYRNTLLHSAFIELKGGEEVTDILRSNPKLKTDPRTGEPLFDQEMLSDQHFIEKMTQLGHLTFRANLHYIQLIHWAPFDRVRKKA
jgi:hypothetical protein